jgi:predicted TIM-barrel fold metal-dependent hydrolase
MLFEMDQANVGRAVIIAAAIGDNPDNNQYAQRVARAYANRFLAFADIDSRWSTTYHRPGAAERLAEAAERNQLVGFTHYLSEEDDGAWLVGEDGRRFFALAEQRRLIASLSVTPRQMPAVAALAARFPRLPILCHHLAHLGPRSSATPDAARLVVAAAEHRNIHIKISGFGNVAAPDQDYPYDALRWIPRMLLEFYGPWRLLWGSDYPVSRRHMTYRQTIDVVRRHGGLGDAATEIILGRAAERLVAER